MKIAKIADAKNRLSELLAHVKRGETVLILERDRPIARIVPAGAVGRRDSDRHLAELERRGIIKRAKRPADPTLLDRLGPPPAVGADILAALLADRDEGR